MYWNPKVTNEVLSIDQNVLDKDYPLTDATNLDNYLSAKVLVLMTKDMPRHNLPAGWADKYFESRNI